MSDGLAAELLSRPGFADRNRFALGELAAEAEAAVAAIEEAVQRIDAGESAQRVAFDVLNAHEGIGSAAVFCELSFAEANYLWSTLDVAESVRTVVRALAASSQLRAGLRAVKPSLAELRIIGEVEVDWRIFRRATLAGHRVIAMVGSPIVRSRSTRAGHRAQDLERRVTAILDALSREIYAWRHYFTERGGRPPRDIVQGWDEPAALIVDIEVEPLAGWTALVRVLRRQVTAYCRAHGFRPATANSLAEMILERVRAGRRDPLGEPNPGAWARYWSAIYSPVMDQPFGLAQIYQPLRARRRTRQRTNRRKVHIVGGEAREVVEVDRELTHWLRDAPDDDALRVISGGPGAGKSSLARMFAARACDHMRKSRYVLYIPLHDFALDDDVQIAIDRYAEEHGSASPFLPVPKGHSALIILDGLDELAAGGRAARAAVEKLFEGVERLLRDHQTENTGRLRILLLGREVVVQAHEHRCRKPGQVLHLLPYRIPPHVAEQLDDPDGLAERDQRHDWWRRYGELTGQDFDGLPAVLDRPQLADLTAEPLLNLLVALTWEAGALDFERDDIGLPAIYADLVRQVFERSYSPSGKLHAVADVALDDYRQFLEAVAVAAWHGEGRTTTTEDILAVAGRRLLERVEVLQRGAEEGIGRLITAFYFRSAGESEHGRVYEFTHQSFAEALLARRIVRFLVQLDRQIQRWEDDDYGWDMATRLAEWYRLFGPAPLEPNTQRFIEAEVATLGTETAARWYGRLRRMLWAVVHDDWPVEAAGPRLAFRVEVQRSRHASAALLAVFGAVGRVPDARETAPGGVFLLSGPPDFSSWWRALRRDAALAPALDPALRGFTFRPAHVEGGLDLRGLDLSDTRWRDLSLAECDLRNARLYGADFSGAELDGCRLEDAVADPTTRWPQGFDPPAAGVIVLSARLQRIHHTPPAPAPD